MTKRHYILLPSSTVSKYVVKFKNGSTYYGPTVNLNVESSGCNPVSLIWLNKRGGWDSFAFGVSRQEDIESERESARLQTSDLSYSQLLNAGIESGIYGLLESDYLDKDTLENISGIADSPMVYLIHLDNGAFNYIPIEVRTRQLPTKSKKLLKIEVQYRIAYERINQNSLNVQPSLPSPETAVEWQNTWS